MVLKLVAALSLLLGAALMLYGTSLLAGNGSAVRPLNAGIVPPVPADAAVPPARPVEQRAESVPVELVIPALGVRAPIRPAGPGARGLPDAPSRRKLGWWRDGPRPGSAAGTIVVTGHAEGAEGGPAAFYDLARAPLGSTVRVVTAGGEHVVYRIVARRTFRRGHPPRDVLTRSGPPRLALVTCECVSRRRGRHHRGGLVVYAVPKRAPVSPVAGR
ncbi:class F sortase [Bailinhaonella thermotolerans]|uniref:Class F sortase n=1 Tax=Bailinhaonella thermotolerans TaxID=1070861 RepID=A0A3A4A390_9ACTN|nr:class F sortase [Bailinhaonella thermotolerans]RJL22062.1 class F sortase [Bailinhaonella thermotolerans]